jgi:hypothetical protein
MWNVLDEFGAHGLPLGALVLVKIIAGVGYPLQALVVVIFEGWLPSSRLGPLLLFFFVAGYLKVQPGVSTIYRNIYIYKYIYIYREKNTYIYIYIYIYI